MIILSSVNLSPIPYAQRSDEASRMMTRMKRLVIYAFVTVTVAVLAVIVGALFRGMSPSDLYRISRTVIRQRIDRKTVDERMAEIEKTHPDLVDAARDIGSELILLVFKRERRVEVFAEGWKRPRVYAMQGFSGVLGPKLKEGDGQIPEGVYGIEYMNPNSLFHLSLKVGYPNAFDLAKAKLDGRTNLGNDIMIHGGSVTVGCVPVGDDGIEEVFYFVGKVGCENVKVVITPYDMRRGRQAELEESDVAWYPALCAIIAKELSAFPAF